MLKVFKNKRREGSDSQQIPPVCLTDSLSPQVTLNIELFTAGYQDQPVSRGLYQCQLMAPRSEGSLCVSTEEAREVYEAQRDEICSLTLPPARELRDLHKEQWIRLAL